MKSYSVVFMFFAFCECLAFAGVGNTAIDRVSQYVNTPTNSLPLGIELGSNYNENHWAFYPHNKELAKIFDSWHCDRSLLTKRICSYRLFSRHYNNEELGTIRHEDLESVVQIFKKSGIKLKLRKRLNAQQIESAFKELLRNGRTDASLWVETWGGSIHDKGSAHDFASIRLNAIDYQGGKGVLSLEVESYGWQQVYDIEQCLMELDESKDSPGIQMYDLPRSLLSQTCSPKHSKGWDVLNLEEKINHRKRVKLTAKEYGEYFNIIDLINELQRGNGTPLDKDRIRLSEIKKLQTDQFDVREKIENKIIPKFDEIITDLHSIGDIDEKQLETIDDCYSKYKKQVATKDEIWQQIAVGRLMRTIVTVVTKYVESTNEKAQRETIPRAINDLLPDCKTWRESNDLTTKLYNEERIISRKIETAYENVITKLKHFEKIAHLSDSRIVTKKESTVVPPGAREAVALVNFLNLDLPGTNKPDCLFVTNGRLSK